MREVLAAFLDAVPHPVLALDTKCRVVEANAQAVELFAGFPNEDLRGRKLECLVHTMDAGRDLKRIWCARGDSSFIASSVVADGDGPALFDVSLGSILCETEGVRLAVFKKRESTPTRNLQRDKELHGARLFEAIKAARVGVFDIDYDGSASPERHYWSSTMRELLAYGPDQPPDFEWFRARVHPDDVARVDAAVARASDPGGDGLIDLEYRWKHPSGRFLWVLARATTYFGEAGGKRVARRTIGTLIDVTERKTAEEEYRTRSAILDASPDLVAIASPDGTLCYLNEAGRKFLAIGSDEDLASRKLLDLHTSACAEKVEHEGLTIALREGVWTAETDFLRHDGQSVPMSQVLLVYRDASGALIHTCTIARDLSKERNLEEQFRHSQRLEAIGQLAGGIAHDFNNLLSAILGFSELASSTLDSHAPGKSYLREVQRAAERAASLTGQLLAFGRKQVRQVRVLDVNEVFDELQPMLRRLVDTRIQIGFVPSRAPARIKADPSQIEQVLLNLVINARDAMPGGGRLTLQAQNVDLDDGVVAASLELPPGPYIVIRVSDTGHGMDAATRERIFEPFFTTKGPGLGSGLGLSTVFGIVRQSGGGISVRSEPEIGTTFEVYFARTEEAVEVLPCQTQSSASVRGEVVLVAEDDEQARPMVVTVLERAGFRVLDAANGSEALSAARQHDGRIDILLTDVAMPGMSGKQLAERLLEIRPEVSVLYMSGHAEGTIAREGLLDSGLHFIAKPIRVSQLLNALGKILDAKRAKQRATQ